MILEFKVYTNLTTELSSVYSEIAATLAPLSFCVFSTIFYFGKNVQWFSSSNSVIVLDYCNRKEHRWTNHTQQNNRK